MDEFDAAIERVRERVVPTPDERDRLEAVAEEVLERAERAVGDLPVGADVVQVGSTARGTWVAGDRDIDIFVRFRPGLDRERLEEYGLEVGHAVLPSGREEYAEHPYVTGEIDGYEVDCVPCYAVPDATEIRSAVDRTPFHNRYLEDRIDGGLADEVRVCKQFLKGIGAYGSDLRTRGFSGFLTELLIVEYGGFRPLVEAASDWHPPVRIDPESHGRGSFEDPLVVIDPTDPERNVAAVCSPDNVARLQHYARELLARPRAELFEATAPEPLSPAAVREAVADRATTPVAVRFPVPDLVADQLWPQLEKSRAGVVAELDRRGFDVLRSRAFAGDDRAVLFAELSVAERPRVERHEGPPVHVRDHAERFVEAYDGGRYGPFIDGDRYVVERDREVRTARAFLESERLREVALGADIEAALAEGYEVLVGEAVGDIAGEFGVELASYFDPAP